MTKAIFSNIALVILFQPAALAQSKYRYWCDSGIGRNNYVFNNAPGQLAYKDKIKETYEELYTMPLTSKEIHRLKAGKRLYSHIESVQNLSGIDHRGATSSGLNYE